MSKAETMTDIDIQSMIEYGALIREILKDLPNEYSGRGWTVVITKEWQKRAKKVLGIE